MENLLVLPQLTQKHFVQVMRNIVQNLYMTKKIIQQTQHSLIVTECFIKREISSEILKITNHPSLEMTELRKAIPF